MNDDKRDALIRQATLDTLTAIRKCLETAERSLANVEAYYRTTEEGPRAQTGEAAADLCDCGHVRERHLKAKGFTGGCLATCEPPFAAQCPCECFQQGERGPANALPARCSVCGANPRTHACDEEACEPITGMEGA